MGNGVADAVRAAIPAAHVASREIGLRWRQGDAWRAVADALGQGEAGVAALLRDDRWVAGLLAPLVDALASDPLFEPPWRLHRDAVRTGAVLVDCAAGSLSASVFDAAALTALPPPDTIVFTGRTTVTRYVKAGGATLQRWALADGRAHALPPVALADGDMGLTHGQREAALVRGARSDIVTLTATLRNGAPPPAREHRIADGALVRSVSNDDHASRIEMLLAFLRESKRADALEAFEAATRDRAHHLRWSAMREWLALDLCAALPRLVEMAANDPHAEVRAAAVQTLAPARARLACRA